MYSRTVGERNFVKKIMSSCFLEVTSVTKTEYELQSNIQEKKNI